MSGRFAAGRWRMLRSAAGVAALGVLLCVSSASFARERARRESGLVFQSNAVDVLAADKHFDLTDVGNVRLGVSNAGTFGTAFTDRNTPSMEWPARSGIDHLVRGALWIGAISAASGDTLVTIGGKDANFNEAIFQYSEYTPVSERPQEYSRLRTSPFYSPGTVSDENFRMAFVDTLPVQYQGGERHKSMGLRVEQETYSWGFDPVDDFVIVTFNVINVGPVALRNMWIGIYSELVTNNRLLWPGEPFPVAGGRWFDFQDLHYDRPRRLLWNRNVERRFVNDQIRGGIQVIGSGGSGPYGRGPDSLATKQVTLSAWNWNPAQFLTWSDDSLYARMSTGQIANVDSLFDPNTVDNGVSILAVGPFPLVAPGDTTQVVFAFLAGEDQSDMEMNSFWAQKAYNDKYALPSPPSPPIVRVYPRHNELVLRWGAQPEGDIDPASRLRDFQGYRIYLSESPEASGFRLVRQVDRRDGIGYDTGLEGVRLPAPVVDGPDTLSYEFKVQGVPDGFKRYVAITSFDYQAGLPRTLESGVLTNSIYTIAGPDAAQSQGRVVSVFPNPYRGESALDGRDAQGAVNPRQRILWFTNLPQRCTLRIYTLAGDLVRTYQHDAATYRGTEADGISPDDADLAHGRTLVSSGSMLAFDLLSDNRQEIATGLYLFTVEDATNGETQQGKFLVLK